MIGGYETCPCVARSSCAMSHTPGLTGHGSEGLSLAWRSQDNGRLRESVQTRDALWRRHGEPVTLLQVRVESIDVQCSCLWLQHYVAVQCQARLLHGELLDRNDHSQQRRWTTVHLAVDIIHETKGAGRSRSRSNVAEHYIRKRAPQPVLRSPLSGLLLSSINKHVCTEGCHYHLLHVRPHRQECVL